MAKKEKKLIEEFLEKIKNHRFIYPIIIFGLIIIGLSKFTNALQDITKFLFPTENPKIINKKINLDSTDINNQSDSKVFNNSYQIFEKSNPYPINYSKVKIGTKLSMIEYYYSESEGSLSQDESRFYLNDKDGVFNHIVFFFENNQEDPKVYLIAFYADNDYIVNIKKQAITAFDTINFKTFNLGKSLEWSNIEGVKVTINSGVYGIQKLSNYN